ncbi:MAG: nucleotidyltransferase domain-containing protein [Candidatus Heimdallarchaeaceae archaeon]
MIKKQENIIETIVKQFHELPSISEIVSILLGGSYVRGNFIKSSDIDLLVISNNGFSDILFSEIKDSFQDHPIRNKLDIKIIDVQQINEISNSTEAPFFYHFTQNSELLYGTDLRSNFSLSKKWMYYTLQSAFDDIEKIKAIVYDYYDVETGKILLFELTKKIMAINLKINNKNQDINQAIISYFDIFDQQKKEKLNKLTNKRKNWIETYKYKRDTQNIRGFNRLRIRHKKNRPKELQTQYIEEWINNLMSLIHNTLDVLDY